MSTLKELREKLKNNIKAIKKICPEFYMTEDQINAMLTAQRLGDHEKAKAYMRNQKSDAQIDQEFLKYAPSKKMPDRLNRNFRQVVKMDGTDAAERFNKAMFSDLLRNDEVGEAALRNYDLHCINSIYKMGKVLKGMKVNESDLLDYAMEYKNSLGIGMEIMYSFNNDNSVDVTNGAREKYETIRDFGQSIGQFYDYPEYAASEMFLTFPISYMTEEQQFSVMQHLDALQVEGKDRLNTYIMAEQSSKKVKGEVEAFNHSLETRGWNTGLVGEDIVEKPGNPVVGGYRNLAQNAKETLNNLCQMNDLSAEMKNAAAEALFAFPVDGSIPGADDEEKIAEKMDGLKTAIRKIKNKDIRRAVLDIYRPMDLFSDRETVKNLVHYAKQDVLLGSDAYRQMNESLKALNEEKTRIGENALTGEDLMSLRTMTERARMLADDFLESATDEQKKYAGSVETISKDLLVQSKNLNRASEGMKLEEVLKGEVRELDITGYEFQHVGNVLSSRIPMKITGADGRPVEGYFTEKTTLDPEKSAALIKAKMNERYPDMEGLTDELVPFIMREPEPKQWNEKQREIAIRLKDQEKINTARRLAKDIQELCDKFLTKKFYYKEMAHVSGNSDVESRNVAMSDVAALLGQEKLLAKATPMILYKDGKAMEGCFMESVKGQDLAKARDGKGNSFLDCREDFLDNSPALKQIADMQVLDYLCGNVDRHSGNLIYQFDDNNKLIGIVGIDNDMSFECYEKNDAIGKMISPDDMKYISSSMKERVMKTTPEMLQTILSGNHLDQTEIDRAVKRLDYLKSKIADHTIAVMPDAEFEEHKVKDFLGKGKTLFQMISDDAAEVRGIREREKARIRKIKIQDASMEQVDLFHKVSKATITQDMAPIQNLLEKMKNGKRHVWGGSPEYDNVETALKNLYNAMDKVSKGNKVPSKKTLAAVKDAYKGVADCCNAYMNRKANQGEINATGKTGRRIAAVKEVLLFAGNRQNAIRKEIGRFAAAVNQQAAENQVNVQNQRNNQVLV